MLKELITKEWGDGQNNDLQSVDLTPFKTTQMNYPNMHQPFDVFCFVFVSHKKRQSFRTAPYFIMHTVLC